jgi:hypothetical protein
MTLFSNLLANAPQGTSLGTIQGSLPQSPFWLPLGAGNQAVQNRFNAGISLIIAFLTVIASLFFLFQLFIAASVWLNAGENEKNAAGARQRIMNSLIGITITVAAYGVAALVGALLGIPLFDPLSLFVGGIP